MDCVFDKLAELNIGYERHEHPAVFTSTEATEHWADIKGAHCKNIFLRDSKGRQHYLVVVGFHKQIQIKDLQSTIGSTRLSFASEQRLEKYLNLKPGSVSPFGLINDTENHVKVIIDSDLKQEAFVNFHPNINTQTLTLSFEDFEKYLLWTGNEIRFLKL